MFRLTHWAPDNRASTPEKRSELLTYFWHRALGDVFLDTGEPALAVEQFEAALKSCTIDGYIKDTQKKLDIAIPTDNLQPDDFESVDLIVDTVKRVASEQ